MAFDVAVIGAGLAGLTCAQRLQQLGLRVVVLEKSRGLGGRLATRRLHQAQADHGVRCLEHQGKMTQALIQMLCQRGILHLWTDRIYQLDRLDRLDRSGTLHPDQSVHPRYAAVDGITAVAKFLGNGLEIWRDRRVQAMTSKADRTWALTLESNDRGPIPDLLARSVVVTIPAPQALALLQPLVDYGLPAEFLAVLRSVEFAPCLTAIACYPAAYQTQAADLPWRAITCPNHADLDWIALDSTKQLTPPYPVVVIQSTATFARSHLESPDLQPAGRELAQRAAQILSWLAEPELLQVHRWRYAFAATPLSETHLSTLLPLPLVCGGDWCGGTTLEAAIQSGLRCAEQIATDLTHRSGIARIESGDLATEGTEADLAAVWQTLLDRVSLNL